MDPETRRPRIARWLPLVLLALALAYAFRHLDEVRRIFVVLGRAHLGWMALALVFQAGTYAAVGFVYRTLSRAFRSPIDWLDAARLAVVNLFVNAAVPSAGLSGNLFLVRMMTRKGVPPGAGSLIVLLERTVYFTALSVYAAVVLAVLLMRGRLHRSEVFAVALLAGLVVALSLAARKVLREPRVIAEWIGRLADRAPQWIRRRIDRPALIEEARGIEDAGGPAAFPASKLALVLTAEGALLIFDSLTVWALFRAVGAPLPFVKAATGYALATVLAQIVVIPGTLEVGLAGLLRGVGATVGAAVAVTLLFHAVSFWLPLPAGWFFYRKAETGRVERRPRDSLLY